MSDEIVKIEEGLVSDKKVDAQSSDEGEHKPAKQQYLASKTIRDQLVKDIHCKELSASVKERMIFQSPIEEMLAEQFVGCHRLGMRVLGQIYDLEKTDCLNDLCQQRLVNTSIRLIDACQKTALAINKLQTGGQQTVVVKHQNVQVNDGGQAIVTSECIGGGRDNVKK